METESAFAPDLLGPVVAFRDWRIFQGELLSPFTGTLWEEPTLQAVCRPQDPEALLMPPHHAPHPDCSCGISAWLEPSDEASKVNFRAVSGIVSLWGRLEIGEDEVRAESARIECLAMFSGWTDAHKRSVNAIANEFDVDVVDLYELRAAAAAYGSGVPSGLKPHGGTARSVLVAA
jgi:hypothetical protein